ncbi:MAG: hypothetical protein EAY68_01415 [Bacteroidetes bacterium]|nr:MAG: hypothetical protein EAY68_01415 [Bacteroidota bacterium]
MQTKTKHLLAVMLVFLTLLGCQKSLVQYEPETATVPQVATDVKKHLANAELWIDLLPFAGGFKAPKITEKTTRFGNSIVTNLQIGENGNSLLFITANKKFQVFGINREALSQANPLNGNLVVYDFQNLSKYRLRIVKDSLAGIYWLKQPNTSFNAYNNTFHLRGAANQRGLGIGSSVRKFFCELFGGFWAEGIAGNATSGSGSCYSGGGGGSTDPEEATTVVDGNSGGQILNNNFFNILNGPGSIYNNISTYVNTNGGNWYSVLPGLAVGGGGVNNNGFLQSADFIDPSCENPDDLRAAFLVLGYQYYQSGFSTSVDGSVEEMFQPFQNYSDQSTVLVPILPWLLKAGINGAADALTQALFIYLTEDDCTSFGAAFGHPRFNKMQVARSGLEGLIPWSVPGGRIGRASFTAMGDVLVKMIAGEYGQNDYQKMGIDFALGFFSDYTGGQLADLASKAPLAKLGKGLVTKFNVPYKTVTKWLGGGLQEISETLVTSAGSVSSVKKMVGFSPGNVCVIGRNMAGRVKPYAEAGSSIIFDRDNPLAAPYFKPEIDAEWSDLLSIYNNNIPYAVAKASKLYQANRQFIRDLKAKGYTFIDLGHGGLPEGSSAFYDMELKEIFE